MLVTTGWLVVAPIELYGGGQYEVSSVKEVLATRSFLGMEQEVRRCQEEEATETCHTRYYLHNLLQIIIHPSYQPQTLFTVKVLRRQKCLVLLQFVPACLNQAIQRLLQRPRG